MFTTLTYTHGPHTATLPPIGPRRLNNRRGRGEEWGGGGGIHPVKTV